MATKRLLCHRKTGKLEKRFASLWRRERITKKAHAGRARNQRGNIKEDDL